MVLTSVYFLLRLRGMTLSRDEVLRFGLAITLPVVTIMLSFGARKQTALVFVVFFCLSLLLMSRGRNFLSLASVILIGTVLGLLYSTTPSTTKSIEFTWAPVDKEIPVAGDTKSPTPIAGDTKSPTPVERKTAGTLVNCEKEGDRITTDSGELVCTSRTVTETRITVSEVVNQTPVHSLDYLEDKREGNRLDARTALAETPCTSYSQLSIENVLCNAKELPYRLSSFLLRPFLFIDSGSLAINLASIENIAWFLILLYFIYCVTISIQNRIHLKVIIPITLFVFSFSILAALYEGNLGTAFRHKSTILWALLLVVAIGFDHKLKEAEQNSKA